MTAHTDILAGLRSIQYAVCLILGFSTFNLEAVERVWDPPNLSNPQWFLPENWTPNGMPTANDDLVIDKPGDFFHWPVVSGTSDVGRDVRLGQNGRGEIHISYNSMLTIRDLEGFRSFYVDVRAGGKLNTQLARLALSDFSATNLVLVTGAGSEWNNEAGLIVGRSHRARVNVADGGALQSGSMFLAWDATVGATIDPVEGRLSVSDPGSTATITGSITVGREGHGTLSVSNQGLVSASTGIVLAQMNNSEGELLIEGGLGGTLNVPSISGGAGMAWLRLRHDQNEYRLDTPSDVPIPLSGSVILMQEGPGSTVLGGNYSHTGGTSVTDGQLIFRAATLSHPDSSLMVAQDDTSFAMLRIEQTSEIATGNSFIGLSDGAFGDVTVSGGSTWNVAGIVVGFGSTGFLTITGDSVVNAGGAMVVGANLDAARQAEVLVAEVGSALNIGSLLQVGGAGSGWARLRINTGASANIVGNAVVGGSGGADDELMLGTGALLDVGNNLQINGNAKVEIQVAETGFGRIEAGTVAIEAGAELTVDTFGPKLSPGDEFEIVVANSGITGAFSSINLPVGMELLTSPDSLIVRVAEELGDELFKDRFEVP